MLKVERQRVILNEVELHNRVLLSDMAEKLDVSIDTVRRDVKELDAGNRLRKVHGGAISLGFSNSVPMRNNVYVLKEKIAIAEKAVRLIRENSVILIDGGTTCMELARILPHDRELTCFTQSLPVAMELLTKPNIRTIFVGGELSPDSQLTIGSNAIHNLSQIRVDYSFIGTGYVDAEVGLTDFDWEIVQAKKAVIQSSRKTALLCISEKLNSRHRFTTCALGDIDVLITELHPSHALLSNFRGQELELR